MTTVALRLGGLGRQSLWADEGNSWGMALRSLGEIGPAAAGDIHPPLYYYLLNLWCRLFGTSEAGMRSLSALFGCLTVLVVYLWARRLAGDWAGVGAGVLAAISPFAIYYSQEARAYALVALLTVAGCWTLSEYLLAHSEGRRYRRWMLGYVLAAASLLWSHYLGLVVLVLYNLVAAAWLWGRQDRNARLKEWAAMQLAAILIFLPWVPQMLGSAGSWPAISAHEPLTFYVTELVRLYTLGPGAEGLTAVSVLGDGERNDPDLRGALTGLSLRHGRAELARAILEAVARLAQAGVGRPQGVSALDRLWRPRLWRRRPEAVRVQALKALAAVPGQEAEECLQAAAGSREAGIRLPARELLRRRSQRMVAE